jgi:hypothetical protein
MSGVNIFTCIYNPSTKQHGDKHALPGAEVRHISPLEELT